MSTLMMNIIYTVMMVALIPLPNIHMFIFTSPCDINTPTFRMRTIGIVIERWEKSVKGLNLCSKFWGYFRAVKSCGKN